MEIHVFEILSMASARFLVVASSGISAISMEGLNVLDPEASISLTPTGETFCGVVGIDFKDMEPKAMRIKLWAL